MKKALILGGSHRDIPLILAAKKLGFFVITLGDRDYYIGHSFSYKSYKIDFIDLEKVSKVLKDIFVDKEVKKNNIQALFDGKKSKDR